MSGGPGIVGVNAWAFLTWLENWSDAWRLLRRSRRMKGMRRPREFQERNPKP